MPVWPIQQPTLGTSRSNLNSNNMMSGGRRSLQRNQITSHFTSQNTNSALNSHSSVTKVGGFDSDPQNEGNIGKGGAYFDNGNK
mmetsp:Transcript_12784/g.21620  ORF Transcript_12784/g.21620 Transcript_12784/m.21620 type:complete len:84 (+) Transcript_12784:112-363(+)